MAAAITAPFAVAAGSLVKGFEGNPLKMGAGRVAAMNMGKETIEEGSQGVTGAIAQNLGIQKFADKNKTLSDNVGEQGGRGALYGFGSAGVMAGPGLVAGAAGSTITGVTNYLVGRADSIIAKNEADSPASINRAVEQSAALVQSAPALKAEVTQALAPVVEDTPEVAAAKATAMADFPGFMDALNIQETELQSPLLQPVASIIAGAVERLSLGVDADAIIGTSESGYTARFVSRERPEAAIIVITDRAKVQRQMCLVWGVTPLFVKSLKVFKTFEDLLNYFVAEVKRMKMISKGDKVVLVAGRPLGQRMNLVQAITVK
jgi:hypothetical protein